ncbi:MAG: replication-associated recombination protein A [Planctomycetes bacterium]|nr:replication-associated recombination protein A [Planctomycetota bacterium]
MRPRTLAEFVGQAHLVGPGKILARVLAGQAPQSLILWGPPGVGKTTLAHLVARASGLRFVPFSAVLAGIKEIKDVMAQAERERRASGRRTLLFVDEIHRFNKSQQDAFLPYVEKGDIVLIGATTENPSFEVVSPLLSRARVLVLQPLAHDELVALLGSAVALPERGLSGAVRASREALSAIANASDGDARRALTLLESAAAIALAEPPAPGGAAPELGPSVLAEALQRKTLAYDKRGEQHYDQISALHKSVRNCDADAALYWLTRMLEAGEDRDYLLRRMVRMALEDVGIADPSTLRAVLDAGEAWRQLGSPEGELALVQAAVLLARAPKSNATYKGYAAAREDVEKTAAEPVPLHLRNAPTGLMKELGYGKGYRYYHDDPNAKNEMKCLPPGLEGRRYLDAAEEEEKGQ